PLLPILEDVQALLVDVAVGHSAVLDDAGVAQLRTVDPSGGAAESRADPGLLALQQMHLARRLLDRPGGDAAAVLLIGVDDAPVPSPRGHVQARRGARGAAVLCHVHPAPARSDDRHAVAGLGAA